MLTPSSLYNRFSFFLAVVALLLSSCSVQRQIHKSANADVLSTNALQAAHVGISIYDPAAGKYLYNYQGDHYFVPASNTKIPTCYAAMKYLGDSLVGLRYALDIKGNDTGYILQATGDPTFLHPDFLNQPVYNFLDNKKRVYVWKYSKSDFDALGSGWSWNDYEQSYMTERSQFPVYGNLVRIFQKGHDYYATPKLFNDKIGLKQGLGRPVERLIGENLFYLDTVPREKQFNIPFRTENMAVDLLKDTLNPGRLLVSKINQDGMSYGDNFQYFPIYSQPTDSVLKPMMHRSDNFFAEQSLLMVSNEMLGVMNDEKIIDTLLKTDFKDLPQKPRWADGSGLSRYNLFTPQDFVVILNKMKNEFGMERIKEIFPTGGEGTISSYYKKEAGFIYGKTGTLSGVVAFSGFLYTEKGKLLIFSTLVNNHNESATDVRRAVEKFLVGIRDRY